MKVIYCWVVWITFCRLLLLLPCFQTHFACHPCAKENEGQGCAHALEEAPEPENEPTPPPPPPAAAATATTTTTSATSTTSSFAYLSFCQLTAHGCGRGKPKEEKKGGGTGACGGATTKGPSGGVPWLDGASWPCNGAVGTRRKSNGNACCTTSIKSHAFFETSSKGDAFSTSKGEVFSSSVFSSSVFSNSNNSCCQIHPWIPQSESY